jgi:sugar O-acyltransferase (sialic acid O-acetyltransferase NeuD family)
MADIVIFGASAGAQVAYAYVKRYSGDRVVGFTVDADYATSDRFEGLPLVAWERLEEEFPSSQVKLLGPISYRRLNELRRARYLEGKARGYSFTSFVHPTCVIDAREIGEHCFILAGTVIEPYASIGNNVVVWGRTYIGHHSVLGDHCFISGEVVIGAGTRVGEGCFIGIRAGTTPGTAIGDGCFVSAGVLVTKDIPSGSVIRRAGQISVASVPADRIRRLL